jgi:hypothetical protein
MSISLGCITTILKNHWKPFEGDDMKSYKMGTIFRLGFNHNDDALYILAVQGNETFALINLDYGSRMSKSTLYKGAAVTQEELERHASYFLKRGNELQVVRGVTLSYDEALPVIIATSERKERQLEGGI